jgi:hypothetical protein
MITVLASFFKQVTQEIYDDILSQILLERVSCSCGRAACFILYGHYRRWLKADEATIRLRIQRVQCRYCKQTHAILPACIVPYSQIPADTHRSILLAVDSSETARIMNSNPDISECDIYHVRQQFRKHWQARLVVLCLILTSPIQELIRQSFEVFHRQFMQIRRGVNLKIFLTNTG